MKGNIFKKYTYEDKFARDYYCCFVNHRKIWAWWKRYARRKFRRIVKGGEFDDID